MLVWGHLWTYRSVDAELSHSKEVNSDAELPQNWEDNLPTMNIKQ